MTTPPRPASDPPPPVHHSMLCPTLVGRAATLHTLQHLYAQAQQGQGQIALVSGEAGIGKSRLVRELHHQLPAARILVSGCYALDQTRPYTPLVTLLRALLDLTAAQHAPLAAARAAELMRLWQGFSDATAAAVEGEQEQQRLLQTLTQRLAQMATDQPDHVLVLVFEDVHWCDDATLEYLTYLAQHLAHHPMLLVLTWRPEALTPALIRCLAAIERTRLATELPLASLSMGELETMLGHIFARPHAIRADFLAALHTLTEGNPFFTEEILRSLVATGDIFVADGHWDRKPLEQLHIPRTVQAAVQQRTATLSPAAQQILTLAAVIGRRFDFPLLQHLAATDERALLSLLHELIDAQLVVESSADTFVFRHELTRHAVYAGLLMRERRLLHRAVVAGIHSVYPDLAEETLLTDLAYHSFQGELWAEAMRYATTAGERAQRLYAPVAAIEHYTNALLAARRLNITPATTLHQARGKMYEMVGGFDAARSDYEQALEIARQAHDARAESQALLDLGFLWTGRDYGRAGDYFQAAVVAARTLDDAAILANTLNRIGLWQTHAERPLDGLQHHQEALLLYERLEDTQGIAETLDLLGVTAFMGGDITLGWRYFRRAIALCRATGNRAQLATNLLTASVRGGALLTDTMVWVTPDHPARDPADTPLRECEEAIALAREMHWPATEAYALVMCAHVLGMRGVWSRALESAHGAVSIAQAIDHRMWLINGNAVAGLIYLDMLDLSAAAHHLELAQRMCEGLNSLYMRYKMTSELSRVYIAQGRPDVAAQRLGQIITEDLPMQTLAQRLIWTAYVELMLAQEQPARALEILESLIAQTANLTGATVIPRLWYLRGKTLAALHREQEAIATLEAAAQGADAWGDLPNRRRIALALGRLHLRRGDRDAAHTAFEQARTTTEALAAQVPDGPQRANFLAIARRDLPARALVSRQRAIQHSFDGLTAREREVAALVAQGKSNRAIADALTLSERTIEKHVENIMAKLGMGSRTQIAVWATEKGLSAPS